MRRMRIPSLVAVARIASFLTETVRFRPTFVSARSRITFFSVSKTPRLSTFERVLLTYALAIRVIRQLLVNSEAGSVAIPPFFKRVSRQLALADYGSRPALLDVLLAPSRNDDRARHAVNSAIVAAAMVRRLVRDDVVLSRVAFEAMLLDFGFGEQAAVAVAEERSRPMLAAALAQIRTGELRGDAVERTLVAFEATSLLGGNAPAQVYFGAHAP